MRLDFSAIERRTKEFLRDSHFKEKFDEWQKDWEQRLSRARSLHDEEERLFYLLLCTHFADEETAWSFYERVSNWNGLLRMGSAELQKRCRQFFREKRRIGDHRRFFRTMGAERRAGYTVQVLEKYRHIISEKYGSQATFFGLDGGANADFDELYGKMQEIEPPFHRRLPRFDHLERLARTHDFYVVPKQFYSYDDPRTGPISGLTLLLFGRRYKDDAKRLRLFVTQKLPRRWNTEVDERFRIQGTTPREVFRRLEEWTIEYVKKRVPDCGKHKAYVFELESCLCNWQKGRVSGSAGGGPC